MSKAHRLHRSSRAKLRHIQPLLEKINAYEGDYRKRSDRSLKEKTNELKARYQAGETLDDLLPEAFALVREASDRVLGMRPYDVQVLGGILLHQGRIAEMKTGEGKTLVSTMPAFLNALSGQGVHIITVNDYLARRDADEMGEVHRFLGLQAGCVLHGLTPEERKLAYDSDITYITNNELGFDYLRDNMATRQEKVVQRGLFYAIIDEVDSVLIDEARTPLIISGAAEKDTMTIQKVNLFVKTLEKHETIKAFSKIDALSGKEEIEQGDYVVNKKERSVNLTQLGVTKAERFFHVPNLADPRLAHLNHAISAALRAHGLMQRDQDYVVRDNEVLIVDEFTGRIMNGRRYSDGLHQAIEAKENVEIKPENLTLATITYQSLFNKYQKKAGMTGTAMSEKTEFEETYEMDVVQVPTNRPILRKDRKDIVYPTRWSKYLGVVEEVHFSWKRGQPVLIGTINIDDSERLSAMLTQRQIPHRVLNAKNDKKEAEIIEQAGRYRHVTIATNMAGRGTDIRLDEKARKAGGLKVIGTERHEARRIDDQLRGRSGRQGDPGESVFYLSLEDELMRLFGSKKQLDKLRKISGENEPIEHRLLTRAIKSAQRRIEWEHYATRKSLLAYDAVNNEQRELIYRERNKVLNGESLQTQIKQMTARVIKGLVHRFVIGPFPTPDSIVALSSAINERFSIETFSYDEVRGLTRKGLIQALIQRAESVYAQREKTYQNEERVREIERQVLLRVIDTKWKAHLEEMTSLRQWVGWKAYAQKDPKLEYKRMSYDLFQRVSYEIQEETIHVLYTMPILLPTPKPARVLYDNTKGGQGMKITMR